MPPLNRFRSSLNIYTLPFPGEAINPQTFVYERDILAEAQVSLKNAWKPMEAKFVISKSAVCLKNTFLPVDS